jgi:hypothetical protein
MFFLEPNQHTLDFLHLGSHTEHHWRWLVQDKIHPKKKKQNTGGTSLSVFIMQNGALVGAGSLWPRE